MVVHVGEMHTDIRPAESEHAAASADGPQPGGRSADEVWAESQGRLSWLRERTAATGFDD
jgi:hypothetical protein